MNYESVSFHRSWNSLPDVQITLRQTITSRAKLVHFSQPSNESSQIPKCTVESFLFLKFNVMLLMLCWQQQCGILSAEVFFFLLADSEELIENSRQRLFLKVCLFALSLTVS